MGNLKGTFPQIPRYTLHASAQLKGDGQLVSRVHMRVS